MWQQDATPLVMSTALLERGKASAAGSSHHDGALSPASPVTL